jgi:hypothetical protein
MRSAATEVNSIKARPSLHDFLVRHGSKEFPSLRSNTPTERFCVDCKWVLNRGKAENDFLCERLHFSCATARGAGAACGPQGELFEPRSG